MNPQTTIPILAPKSSVFRVLDLSVPSYIGPVELGVPHKLANAVSLTLGSTTGESLIEIHRGEADLQIDHIDTTRYSLVPDSVTVAGQEVIDVMPLFAGQEFMINDRAMVLLRPMQTYMPTRPSNQRQKSLARLIDEEVLTSEIAALLRGDSRNEKIAEPNMLPEGSRKVIAHPSFQRDQTPRKVRRHGVRNRALLAATVMVSVLMMMPLAWKKISPKNFRFSQKTSATNSRQDEKLQEKKPVENKAPEKKVPVPISRPNDFVATTASQDPQKKKPSPVAEEKPPKPKPSETNTDKASKKPIVKNAETASQGKKTKPAKEPPLAVTVKIPAEKLREFKERYDEYRLESNFDPAAAKEKFSRLLKEIPAGSDIATQVKQEIGKLGS